MKTMLLMPCMLLYLSKTHTQSLKVCKFTFIFLLFLTFVRFYEYWLTKMKFDDIKNTATIKENFLLLLLHSIWNLKFIFKIYQQTFDTNFQIEEENFELLK